jgi:hypothetical protein
MTQAELNRAVARAIGETVQTVADSGFLLASPDVPDHDPEPDIESRIVDWDEYDARRSVPLFPEREPCAVLA